MVMTTPLEPYAALVDIAERSLQKAHGLPAQLDIKQHWSGVGFLLGGFRFVAPMGEVAEILEQPVSTRLPGVQGWVQGVANVRGRLLPMIDLESYFGGSLAGSRKSRRVLAVEFEELYSGLIVNEVYGMQHFPVDCFSEELPSGLEALEPFLTGSYQHNGAVWVVFSPFKLAKDSGFLNAAAS